MGGWMLVFWEWVCVCKVHLTGRAAFLLHHTHIRHSSVHTPAVQVEVQMNIHIYVSPLAFWSAVWFMSAESFRLCETLTCHSLWLLAGLNIQTLQEDGEKAEKEEFDRGIQRAGTGTSSRWHTCFSGRSQSKWQHHNRGQKTHTLTHTQRHGSHTDAGCLRRRNTVLWRPDSELPCFYLVNLQRLPVHS